MTDMELVSMMAIECEGTSIDEWSTNDECFDMRLALKEEKVRGLMARQRRRNGPLKDCEYARLV